MPSVQSLQVNICCLIIMICMCSHTQPSTHIHTCARTHTHTHTQCIICRNESIIKLHQTIILFIKRLPELITASELVYKLNTNIKNIHDFGKFQNVLASTTVTMVDTLNNTLKKVIVHIKIYTLQ